MFDFTIDSSIFDEFNEATEQIFERAAILVFPEKREDCPNCYLNTFGTQSRTVSIYKVGGPYPFEEGMPCPYCDGKGYKQIEVAESIPIQIYWEIHKSYKPLLPIDIPQGSIQTIVRSTYTPKVEMAKYLIPKDSNIESLDIKKYVRFGPSVPIGFKNNPTKYIINFWQQNAS